MRTTEPTPLAYGRVRDGSMREPEDGDVTKTAHGSVPR